MKPVRKIGVATILLSIVMLFFGASIFSYRGELSSFVSEAGKYSFLFWLSTLIIGIILVARR